MFTAEAAKEPSLQCKDIPVLSEQKSQWTHALPTSMTHRSSRRPSQQKPGQTVESLRCVWAGLTLRLTQPSLRRRPSWLTHACEDQRYLKPPSLKKKPTQHNAKHRTHTWCSKTLPLIILKPLNYYLTLLSPSVLREAGVGRNFPAAETRTRCFVFALTAAGRGGGDAAFSLVSKQFVQFGSRTHGQVAPGREKHENRILCRQDRHFVSLNMRLLVEAVQHFGQYSNWHVQNARGDNIYHGSRSLLHLNNTFHSTSNRFPMLTLHSLFALRSGTSKQTLHSLWKVKAKAQRIVEGGGKDVETRFFCI